MSTILGAVAAYLGEFEYLILLAIARLGEAAMASRFARP
jgi:hypothetical protein